MNVTVLGASGGIGTAVVEELAQRGHDVTAASRTALDRPWRRGVRVRATDLRNGSQAAAACRDAEVVVMAAQVPYSRWRTELGPLVDAAVRAAADAGARFVMADNLYAYGSPGTPISEATPEGATTRKGRLRAELGRRLLAAHTSGRLPVAIGRFSDYYGPNGRNSLVFQLGVQPALAGRAARAFIRGDQAHTFHHLPDAARGFATLVEQPAADGNIWILPAADAITQQQLYLLLGEVLGIRLRIGRVTPGMLWLAGWIDREMREAREVVPQFARPYVTDPSRFVAAFGPIEVTGHREALETTVAWARGGATVAT